MAISGIVWFVLISGITLTVISLAFVGVLIWNFHKKRTIGTAMLALFFTMIALSELSNAGIGFVSALNPLSKIQGIFLVSYLIFNMLTYIVLYFFTNRHILRDNDFIRALISIFLLVLAGVLCGIIGYEIFAEVPNPIFYEITTEPGTNFEVFMPTLVVGILVYAPILILVQIRIIIQMSFVLTKEESPDKIRRRGMIYILASIITLFLSLLVSFLFTIQGMGAAGIIILTIFRRGFVIATLFLSYIGWILPGWFRRRIRRKTWIGSQITSGKQPTSEFISFQTITVHEKSTTITASETTEL